MSHKAFAANEDLDHPGHLIRILTVHINAIANPDHRRRTKSDQSVLMHSVMGVINWGIHHDAGFVMVLRIYCLVA